MASLDELIASITANKDATDELSAQIEGTKQHAEELLGQVTALGAEGVANAVMNVKERLEQCASQNHATALQLEEAVNAAVAAKQA
jgi:maltodextrin utilization protein YvdJ